jgi:hypothetical protein
MCTDGIQIIIKSNSTSCYIEIRLGKKKFFRIIILTNKSIEFGTYQGYTRGCFKTESIPMDKENT